MNTTIERKTELELVNYCIDKLRDLKGSNIYGCDLHNELFNTNYYIIGYYNAEYNAEQWLIKNTGIFSAIEEIKEYEQSNFGAVTTDLSSSEKVCNMIVYIYGEELLSGLDSLRNCWDSYMTDEDFDSVISELEEML